MSEVNWWWTVRSDTCRRVIRSMGSAKEPEIIANVAEFRHVLAANIQIALAAAAIVLFAYAFAQAGTPRQKAIAAVAVARARVTIANQKAVLPDSKDKFNPPVAVDRSVPETSSQIDRGSGGGLSDDDVKRLQDSLEESRKTLVERQETIDAQTAEINQLRASKSNKPELPIPAVNASEGPVSPSGSAVDGGLKTLEPMRLIIPASSVGPRSEPAPRAQLIVGCWKEGCQGGKWQKAEIEKELGEKNGKPWCWSIGASRDCQIVFEEIPTSIVCPQIDLYRNGSKVRSWDKPTPVGTLTAAWNEAYRTSFEPDQSFAASGAAGGIKCRQQIIQMRELIRQRIGEGIRVDAILDRSGVSELPLLARGDWSWVKLMGASGHFQIDADGSRLPISHAGLAYRIVGDSVFARPDELQFEDVLRKFPINKQVAGFGMANFESPSPVGLFVIDDIIEIGSLISAIHAIASLLQPSCDVMLPGQIAGSLILNGDTITIDFSQPISLRLTWLFQFNLAAKQLIITEDNVHLNVSGSRWIKSRDFPVQ